ncbi:hypothetical protein [Plantactinospora endophytica]|uniref:Uncharacterized protein n=1 Tax=Plantactinospora endophytica TaxID=673535 RepID=A0ABQ4E2E3_9ACTN|nr:hypothetical protein [Plantactinospora endophytica]GIG88881.1 hypothetical protein Pen02_38170 [Plantactinospora endophytica]
MTAYLSSSPAERDSTDAQTAYGTLDTHVLDRETGLCLVCLTPGPCRPANAAANRLVALGRQVLAPEPAQPRSGGWHGWPDTLRRYLARTAPLLTAARRRRLSTTATAPKT